MARLVVNLAKRLLETAEVRMVQVNGEAGLLFVTDGEPDQVLTFSFTTDGKVRRFEITPEMAGMTRQDPGALKGGDAPFNTTQPRF